MCGLLQNMRFTADLLQNVRFTADLLQNVRFTTNLLQNMRFAAICYYSDVHDQLHPPSGKILFRYGTRARYNRYQLYIVIVVKPYLAARTLLLADLRSVFLYSVAIFIKYYKVPTRTILLNQILSLILLKQEPHNI